MVKVKICGLTTLEQVQATEKAGADYIGFVFAKSKRKIEADKVAEITQNLSPNIKKVGVFVSPNLTELVETIATAKLDVIQLHGELSEELQEKISNHFFKSQAVAVIQAFSGQKKNLSQAINKSRADFILLDAPAETTEYAGGNGLTFNWEDTYEAIKMIDSKKIFIAGGLNSNNVERACQVFNPYAVDVSSGVETQGKKDIQKIKTFIQVVREEQHVQSTK